jgi:1-aminocyclopropane-1-carboxylate deaminase/D-cysteine desulfhydrase-like pyridoxal-dependent ACC family enzyme
MQSSGNFVRWFRQVAPYVHDFGGRTFVIAFGGEMVAERARFESFIHDVNLLAALEMLGQCDEAGVQPAHIFMAAGTSAAGLALAGKLLGLPYRVHPVSVRPKRAEVEQQVCGVANKAAELLGLDNRLTPDDIDVHDEYVGEDYGIVTDAGVEAIRMLGRTEGLILDPVYTAKAASAMIDQIREGNIGEDEPVVFVHTGGLPITFAYNEEIMNALD